MRAPVVAHFRNEYLPITETFIHDLLLASPGHSALAVFRTRLNEDHFAVPPRAVQTTADFYRPSEGVDELTAELRQLGVHACHAEFGWDLPLTGEIAERLDAALAVSFHGADATSRVRDPRWRERYSRWLPRAGLVTVAYAGLAESLVALGASPGAIEVVPTMVDGEAWPRAARPSRSGPVSLLAVGRLIEKKGHRVLLEALALAVAEGADLRLRIAGGGPLRSHLESRAAELGLEARVSFLGPVGRPAVRELMVAADAFVQPSLTAADGEQEGVPVVIKEAACTGLPVVASRHAGIPAVVVEGVTGFLAAEGEPESLAEALMRLVAARPRWAELGEAGRRHLLQSSGREQVLERWAGLWSALHRVSSRSTISSPQ